ncbi:MAG TPA: cobyric acid synthase [Acidimicrobiales bacterium]|nr:cobyric acid synthase [Acidimicrobiales bacterium]
MAGLRGGLVVCGTTSDAGKSWVVAGLCRLLARQGVSVAPFKAQNMALNAAVTGDGAEIGHAQWVQALAAGVPAEAAMNPVLLKPTGETTSQVVVMGRVVGERSAHEHQDRTDELRPVVAAALADLRHRFGVVICEGAGGAAEINLLDRDLANLPLAAAASLPALIVGDIERGGVFAALYGSVALLPDELRRWVRGFVINRFRGDPALLGDGCDELERRCGVPTLGVVPMVPGLDLDAEDSLALDRWDTEATPTAGAVGGGAVADDPSAGGVSVGGAVVKDSAAGGASAGGASRDSHGGGLDRALDVAVVRFPRVSNFGDLDPLRLEPGVSVRWVRSPAALGRPHLVVLPGSKATRDDLAWLRASGLAAAIAGSGAAVVGICAGLQMLGRRIDDPGGIEGPPGAVDGLGRLDVTTTFGRDKVLDRPQGSAIAGGPGPGSAARAAGYRIHHGVVRGAGADPWLVADDGTVLGWAEGRTLGTTLHGLFDEDDLRAAILAWASELAGLPRPSGPAGGPGVRFAAARDARLDRIADALETHLDIARLTAIIAEGARTAHP